MKRFLHFNQAASLVAALDDVLAFIHTDSVSVTHKNSRGSVECSVSQTPDCLLSGQLRAATCVKKVDIAMELHTNSGALLSLTRDGIHKLDLGVTFASMKFTTPPRTSPFRANCAVAVDGVLHTPSADWSMLFGVKHGKTVSLLTSFSAPFADVSVGSFITEKRNSMEVAVMTTLGPFASLKGDIKVHQLEALEIGWIYRIPRFVGFVKGELVRRVLHLGVLTNLGDGTKLALLAKVKHGFVGLETGLHAFRTADLKARLNVSGQVDMEMTFRPSKLVGVTLRSSTSAKTRFHPVDFGFSLAFDTSEFAKE